MNNNSNYVEFVKETQNLLSKYGYLYEDTTFTKIKRLSLRKKACALIDAKIKQVEKDYVLDDIQRNNVRNDVIKYFDEKQKFEVYPLFSWEFVQDYKQLENKYGIESCDVFLQI